MFGSYTTQDTHCFGHSIAAVVVPPNLTILRNLFTACELIFLTLRQQKISTSGGLILYQIQDARCSMAVFSTEALFAS